jgi:hypothetical protein
MTPWLPLSMTPLFTVISVLGVDFSQTEPQKHAFFTDFGSYLRQKGDQSICHRVSAFAVKSRSDRIDLLENAALCRKDCRQAVTKLHLDSRPPPRMRSSQFARRRLAVQLQGGQSACWWCSARSGAWSILQCSAVHCPAPKKQSTVSHY